MTARDRLCDLLSRSLAVDERQLDVLRSLCGSGSEPTPRIVFVLRRHSSLEAALLYRALRIRGIRLSMRGEKSFPRQTVPPELLFQPPSLPDIMTTEASLPELEILPLRGRSGSEITLRGTQRVRARVLQFLEGLGTRVTGSQLGERRVILFPVAFFAGRGPTPWPTQIPWSLDFPFLPLGELWRSVVFLLYRSTLRLDLGPPISVTPGSSPLMLLRELSLALYRKEKAARGAPTWEPETVESIVLSGSEFEEVLGEMSGDSGLSREELYLRAQRIFRSTAGSLQRWAIAAMYAVLKRTIPRLFDLRVRGIERLREEITRHPVILLPAHRSHFDYLAISYALYNANLPLPFIAAGDNLNFFPVGTVLRASGAFFIRRGRNTDRLYPLILERYLSALVKHGDLLEFYLEGGRSRTGFTLAPKFGLLRYLVSCFQGGERSDLRFIPVGVTYERVPEITALLNEALGEKKKPESIFQLIRFRRKLRNKFGELLISFGEPLSLRELSLLPRTKPSRPGPKERALTEDLGYTIIRGIQRQLVLTHRSLAAAAQTLAGGGAGVHVLADFAGDILRTLAALNGEYALSNIPNTSSWDAVSPSARTESRLNDGLVRTLRGGAFGEQLRSLVSTAFPDIAPNADLFMNEHRLRLHERQYLSVHTAQLLLDPILLTLGALAPRGHEALFFFHQLFKPLLLLPHWEPWRRSAKEAWLALVQAGWFEGGIDPFVELRFTNLGRARMERLPRIFMPYLIGLRVGCDLCSEERWSRSAIEDFGPIYEGALESAQLSNMEFELASTLSVRSFVLDFVARGGRIFPEGYGPLERGSEILAGVIEILRAPSSYAP